jgi:sphingosine kinase
MNMFVDTEYKRHAYDLAKTACFDDHDVIMCISGDGIVHEILNGLASTDNPIQSLKKPISVIPAGTGNGLCHSLGHKGCFDALLKALFGISGSVDMVECWQPSLSRSIYSLLSQSWGVIADVDFQSEKHRWMGEFRFTFTALQKILRRKSYNCTIAFQPDTEFDQEYIGSSFEVEIEKTRQIFDILCEGMPADDLMIPKGWKEIASSDSGLQVFIGCNSSHIASDIQAAPVAQVNDGKIYLIWADGLSRGDMTRLFLELETGSHIGKRGVHVQTTRRYMVTPSTSNTSFDFDGEEYENVPTIFTMLHNAATLIL